LRSARQARQLSGGGVAVDCQSSCQPAGGLSSVSAGRRAQDRNRWRKTGIPEDIVFKTKPQIAFEQIHEAYEAGLPRGVVLMDAGYGANTELRTDIAALGLSYVAGIMPNSTVWIPGTAPLHAKTWSGRGRPPKLIRRDRHHQPVSVKKLALSMPARAWRTIPWRKARRAAHFAFGRLRVRVAHRDYNLTKSRPERMAVDRVAEE